MSRTALKPRRQNATRDLFINGRRYSLCIGYDEVGNAREVFADGEKFGSAMQAFVSDACVIISIALQHGISRDELARSMGVAPAFHDGKEVEQFASPIGAILAAIEDRPEIAKVRAEG